MFFAAFSFGSWDLTFGDGIDRLRGQQLKAFVTIVLLFFCSLCLIFSRSRLARRFMHARFLHFASVLCCASRICPLLQMRKDLGSLGLRCVRLFSLFLMALAGWYCNLEVGGEAGSDCSMLGMIEGEREKHDGEGSLVEGPYTVQYLIRARPASCSTIKLQKKNLCVSTIST